MYAKGSISNTEYKNPDHSFYRGIVLDDKDPNKLMRLKVFIPELSNQPYESWFDEYSNGTQEMRQPGKIGPLQLHEVDTLKELLPWAEQMAPLMGESGLSHYFAPKGEQRSKATYVKDGTKDTPPSAETGGLPPRDTIAGEGADCADEWVSGKYGKSNPHGGAFAPKNSGSIASGVYGVPPVGSHVWVFHYRGDLNFPVYFGTSTSYRETGLVWGNDEQTYPFSYESNGGEEGVEDTPPDPSAEQADGLDPRWDALISRARELGAKFRITDGFRSVARQNQLYAQGRTRPGKIVTNARGGQSKHNKGLAIDVVWTGGANNLNALYNAAELEKIARIFQQAGREQGVDVRWGGDWSSFKDTPHLEIR
jgi:hypothetical protein|tara:strand:- start:2602 stop:3699 length:1098 start_codon:yes stop_codon:yes gene_type:complete